MADFAAVGPWRTASGCAAEIRARAAPAGSRMSCAWRRACAFAQRIELVSTRRDCVEASKYALYLYIRLKASSSKQTCFSNSSTRPVSASTRRWSFFSLSFLRALYFLSWGLLINHFAILVGVGAVDGGAKTHALLDTLYY